METSHTSGALADLTALVAAGIFPMGALFDEARPPSILGSFGDMYSKILQFSTALLVVGNLVAMIRPAIWSSWVAGKPATWDLLGDCELLIGFVREVTEYHVNVKLIRFM